MGSSQSVRRAGTMLLLVFGLMVGMVGAAVADSTAVPGHQKKTSGVVMGAYDALYAYDAQGDYYFDLGDGRVQTSTGVSSVDDLDADTLSVCDYRVIYQGSFGDDPFLDTGWIRNNVNCRGYDGKGNYNSLYIHESDPRYTGEREAIWETWEIFVDAVGGAGNVANPQRHVG